MLINNKTTTRNETKWGNCERVCVSREWVKDPRNRYSITTVLNEFAVIRETRKNSNSGDLKSLNRLAKRVRTQTELEQDQSEFLSALNLATIFSIRPTTVWWCTTLLSVARNLQVFSFVIHRHVWCLYILYSDKKRKRRRKENAFRLLVIFRLLNIQFHPLCFLSDRTIQCACAAKASHEIPENPRCKHVLIKQ